MSNFGGFTISKRARENADAATSFDLTEPTPESGVVYKENTDKNGKLYRRWSEPVTIVSGEHEDKTINNKNVGHPVPARQFYAQLRIGDTSKLNKGRTMHARFNVDFEALKNDDPRSEWMNNKSIKALETLLMSAGIAFPTGDITEEILNAAFPKKGTPGKSIIAGKRVTAAVVASERSDGKTENGVVLRQTQVEEFLAPGT